MHRIATFPGLASALVASVAFAADTGSGTASPASQSVRIQGYDFTVKAPYAEGHVLTAVEASNLNQLLAENIRNNVAGKIKTAKEKFVEAGNSADAFTLDIAISQGEGQPDTTLRAICQDYADQYAFGVRTARTSEPADPVEREAKRIATEMVNSALAKGGVKKKDLPEGKYDEMVSKVMLKDDVVKEAKRRVKAKEGIGLDELGLGATEAAAETPAAG